MGYKLFVNGIPAIINGKQKGTLTFGGSVYQWDNTIAPLPKLSTPLNVSIDGTTVSWDEVENATSYEVLADGVSIGEVVE